LWRRNDLGAAATELRRAAELIPDDMEVHYALGRVLQKSGAREDAAVELKKAQELNQKAQNAILAKSYNTLATKLLEENKFEEASTKLREALRLDPQSAPAHYNYGVALFELNQAEQAITELKSSLSLNPDEADAYYYLGRAALALRQPAEAAKDLQQALSLNARDARAHNVRAVALAELQQIPEATDELRAAVELEPGNAAFRDNLRCLEQRLAGCTLKP
jgi:superkiller protein 3